MAQLGAHVAPGAAPQATVDADTLVRSLLFVGVFLAAWISFHPFQSRALPPQAITEGGDIVNQLAFSSLFLALLAWTWFHEPQRLLFAARPVLVVLLLWIGFTCLTSWEPALAVRRFAFAVVLLGIGAMVLLLPKNTRHFSDLIAADPYAALTNGAVQAFYIGPSSVIGGTKTEMVAWADSDVFMQIWIGADDKLPRRFRAVFADDPLKLRHEMELTNWQLDPAVAPDAFVSAKAQSAGRMAFAAPTPPPKGAKPLTAKPAAAAQPAAKSN